MRFRFLSRNVAGKGTEAARDDDSGAHSAGPEGAALGRTRFLLLSFAAGVFVLLLPSILDPVVPQLRKAPILDSLMNAMPSVGAGIVASVLFYYFYHSAAEGKIHEALLESAIRAGRSRLEEENRRDEYLRPTDYYSGSDDPQEQFNTDYRALQRRSTKFFFRSDTANFASYRLTLLTREQSLLSIVIKLLLTDPRESDLFKVRAMEMGGDDDLIKRTAKRQREVLVTLVALFDIRDRARVEVAFHREFPFFRAEIFDDGLFLTYHYEGNRHSYFYKKATYIYEAVHANFLQSYEVAGRPDVFHSGMTEGDLYGILKRLKCDDTIENLRKEKEEHFRQLKQFEALVLGQRKS